MKSFFVMLAGPAPQPRESSGVSTTREKFGRRDPAEAAQVLRGMLTGTMWFCWFRTVARRELHPLSSTVTAISSTCRM